MIKLKPTLEWVCSGNCSRSEAGRLTCLEVLEEHGALDRYNVISSGIVVDNIRQARKRESPLRKDVQDLVLRVAINQDYFGIITPLVEELVEGDKSEGLGQADKERLNIYVLEALDTFVAEEYKYRENAIKELGLGQPKQGHIQTIARDDTILVLGASQEHKDFIDSIYNGAKTRPTTGTIRGYATEGRELELGPGTSNFDFKDYFKILENTVKYSREATEMFLDQVG